MISQSFVKAFDSHDIYELERQINLWSTHQYTEGAKIIGEEQSIEIIGTKYIFLLRYHIEWINVK